MSELGRNDKPSQMKKVVGEITFQTNILTLGAAIEAGGDTENGSALAQGNLQAAWNTAVLIEESIANGVGAVRARARRLQRRQSAEGRPFAAQVQSLYGALRHLRDLLDGSGSVGAAPLHRPVGSPSRNPGAETHLQTSAAAADTAPEGVSAPVFQSRQRERRA